MALKLFGVTVNDAHLTNMGVPDTETVVLRDLAAVCAPAEYHAVVADDDMAVMHDRVIATLAGRGPFLPAPLGVVFRSAESIQRWLELHYSALTGAMAFVENRVAGRVHVYRGAEDEAAAAGDITAAATESIRMMRATAVATLPLRAEKLTGVVMSAAFLVEEDKWKDLVEEVAAQSTIATSLRFELTGPWPPYDFVQMQLEA